MRAPMKKDALAKISEAVPAKSAWQELAEEQAALQPTPATSEPPNNDQLEAAAEILNKSPLDNASEILAELLKRSPAFRQVVQKRVAASRPVLQKIPMNKARDFQINFGSLIMPGSTGTMYQVPPGLFRGEKIFATTGSAEGDMEVLLVGMYVGQKSQFRPGIQIPLADISTPLSSGIGLDTCDKDMGITVALENRGSEVRTVNLTIFGRVVL